MLSGLERLSEWTISVICDPVILTKWWYVIWLKWYVIWKKWWCVPVIWMKRWYVFLWYEQSDVCSGDMNEVMIYVPVIWMHWWYVFLWYKRSDVFLWYEQSDVCSCDMNKVMCVPVIWTKWWYVITCDRVILMKWMLTVIIYQSITLLKNSCEKWTFLHRKTMKVGKHETNKCLKWNWVFNQMKY